MNERAGKVFSIAEDNAPILGCTVSKAVCTGAHDVTYFSLAKETDISAEVHPFRKLIVVAAGSLEVYGEGTSETLAEGECLLVSADVAVGMRTTDGCVYTEISIGGSGEMMGEAVEAGKVFKLAGLVPYLEGKVVNMDVVQSYTIKFVVMAFDEGTGLSEHAAPGEALVFALDGEAVIGYEGEEHPIRAGENFHFAKGGLHSVRAKGRFKMALLLTLE